MDRDFNFKTGILSAVENAKELLNVSDADWINYNLYKQKLSLKELIEQTDYEGNIRDEDEVKAYQKLEEGRNSDYNRFSKYMTMDKMPKPGYSELCIRLHIKEKQSLEDVEAVANWKINIGMRGAGFGKRLKNNNGKKSKNYSRPTKNVIATRREEVVYAEQDRYYNEAYSFEEEMYALEKKEFIKYAKNLPEKVLLIWGAYEEFFGKEHLEELCFFDAYLQLNELGKKIIREIMSELVIGNIFDVSDSKIDLYQKIKQEKLIGYIENKENYIDEIWENWMYREEKCDIEFYAKVSMRISKCEEMDWDALIKYHCMRIIEEKETQEIQSCK